MPRRRGATVEFRNVSKVYGDSAKPGQDRLPAVHNLSLVAPPGEICALVGPSGCGKTTTLKMVNRLVEPTSGHVLIDGDDVTTVDAIALRRRIGYVIQQVGLLPHQTVADNIATVPRLLGWPRRRISQRIDELLTLIGLDPALVRRRYPHQLSGGERQRVGVARALAAEPPLLLMDEPFGAVDPVVRRHLQDEFIRLHRQIGTTILLVTHDIDEAIKMADRLAVMQQGGRLLQYARPVEVLARPVNDFVARFVGADRALKLLGLLTVSDVIRRGTAVDPNLQSQCRLRGDTSLRDALPVLLAAPGQVGAVTDEVGRPVGYLSLEAIGTALRTTLNSFTKAAPDPAPGSIAAARMDG